MTATARASPTRDASLLRFCFEMASDDNDDNDIDDSNNLHCSKLSSS
jgi:hypothetical protein